MTMRHFIATIEFSGWPIPGENMAERVRAAIQNGPYSFLVDGVEVLERNATRPMCAACWRPLGEDEPGLWTCQAVGCRMLTLPQGPPARRVIVESPFMMGPPETRTPEAREAAIRYARKAMADCFRRGEAPFASHLLYTQPGILDDDNPEERNIGIRAGLLWGQSADATVVYTDLGVSPGMERGIRAAEACKRPVERRTLPDWNA